MIITPLLVSKSNGDARTEIIKMYCAGDLHNNQTLFISNFISAMQIISTEMQTSNFATTVVGFGPDTNYVLTQCYGDLSSQDCILCYAQIRSYDVKKLAKILNDSNLHFKYSTIYKATRYWHESNKLGQGGFGTVYKGVLADGREIAVKRLFFNYKFKAIDFYNEVNIISSLEHKNLVRLLGCNCSQPESILIYEYMPNKSLDFFIFDEIKGKEIGWEKRVEIIIGVAEGLVYLHNNTEHRIIHRDIKAPNILLDLRLRPKIADFGLARSFQDDISHISTGIVGTLGYVAPEYLAHGQLTEKADVYSFGILILEVVTGMESNRSKTTEYSDSLLSTAWKHFKQGTVEEIFDPNLMMHVYPNINFKKDAIKVVHVALLCTQEAPSLRPSMSAALKMLEKDEDPLPAPSNPPFINETTMELNITQRSMDNCDDDDSIQLL
ncbi:hypothetical protein E3N88_42194 [Mikania micrantha]|uniref:Protein kinase domain-containing protein n=1 Tax=Mikania micrantha TaxID=192012 RepID=A0A5N6LIF7_9ASTR|nr:hypothetical protein E3N88_42194 [Mikania micrantha]